MVQKLGQVTALKLSADQMYSNPTRSPHHSSHLTNKNPQNPEETLQKASVQTSNSPTKEPEKLMPTEHQSNGISDLVNNGQSNNRRRNLGYEM
ncbi:MAG: hypothetical protein ACK5X0_19220 [Rhodospirillales bacterium]